MKIYCNNSKCKFYKALEENTNFIYRKYYVPIGKDDNKCTGMCKNDFCGIETEIVSGSIFKRNLPVCSQGKKTNCGSVCLWNSGTQCDRHEIFIDKVNVNDKDYYICKCHSDVQISGHLDFSRFGIKKDMY